MKKEIVKNILDRIEKERPNLKHIIEKRPYSINPYHKIAVEVYSFELLEEAILTLKKINKFETESSEILKHIRNRNAEKTYKLLDAFEKKLTKYYVLLQSNDYLSEDIFELKPNFWGLGINLKALCRRFIRK